MNCIKYTEVDQILYEKLVPNPLVLIARSEVSPKVSPPWLTTLVPNKGDCSGTMEKR
jgi:hypothetical protein